MHRGLPLAPYFPSNYPTNSHNAHELFGVRRHELFGVRRLEQLVTALPLHLRNPAMSTIFVEANQRAKNPVGAARPLSGRYSVPSTSTRRNLTACATSLNCAPAAAMLWRKLWRTF
ncbi:hypothetical protein ACFX13_043612 [Malus domestica]